MHAQSSNASRLKATQRQERTPTSGLGHFYSRVRRPRGLVSLIMMVLHRILVNRADLASLRSPLLNVDHSCHTEFLMILPSDYRLFCHRVRLTNAWKSRALFQNNAGHQDMLLSLSNFIIRDKRSLRQPCSRIQRASFLLSSPAIR